MKQIAKFQLKNDIRLNDNIVLKQYISIVPKIIVSAPILFIILFLAELNIWNFTLSLIFIPIFGFNYEYVIKQDAKCHSQLKLFSLMVYSYAKNFTKPEYLSLMNQSYKEGTGWMWDPFIKVYDRYKLYTIKFFNGNKRETIFKTTNKEEAILKANELSKLLNVRINNTLKSQFHVKRACSKFHHLRK